MRKKKSEKKERTGLSNAKLLLGAGGLLLFIIGLKRSHKFDDDDDTDLRPGESDASRKDSADSGASSRQRAG